VEKAEHAKEDEAHGGIHMPFQSIYPLVASVGLFVMGLGVAVLGGGAAVKLPVSIAGIAIMFIGIFMWAHEGNEGYHIHPKKEDL
jgi:cytochrome c oxidase subunit I